MVSRLHVSLPVLVCLAYVVWRPVSNGQLLYPALALIAGASLVDIVLRQRGTAWVAKPFAWAGVLAASAVLLAAFVGSLRGNPGLTQQTTVWLGGLIIWGIWAASLEVHTVRRVLTAITVGTIALSGLIVLYIGAQVGVLPQIIPPSLLEEQNAGFDDSGGGTAIRLFGLSTLTIVAPMMIVGTTLARSCDPLLPNRKLMAIAAVLAVVAAFTGGRRSIAVVTLATPILIWLIRRILENRKDRRLVRIPVWLVFVAPLILVGGVEFFTSAVGRQTVRSVGDALAVFVGVGRTNDADSDSLRAQQSAELLNGWGDHPFLGSGLGGVLASGFTRSDERPWAFELQYHQLLFNMGLIGVTLLVAGLVLAAVGLRRAAHVAPQHLPTLLMVTVGAVSLLISNASNPYLQAVGHQWGVFLAVGVANAVLRSRVAEEPGTGRASPPSLHHRIPYACGSSRSGRTGRSRWSQPRSTTPPSPPARRLTT